MTIWLDMPFQMQFRVIDETTVRFARTGDRDDHALLLSPWPESLLAFDVISRRLHPVLARQPGPVTHPACQRKATLMRTPLKSRTRKARLALAGAAVAALIAVPSAVAAASTSSPSHPAGSGPASAAKPTIVLEHGAWADGSSWSGVVTRLQEDGYAVDVPPNPLRGVSSDSAYLAGYLGTVPGPVVLAGHSADLPAGQAAELAATQRPIAASALTEVSGPPAWASIPSWAVIGTADHAIPPAAQEFMAARAHAMITKINASHLSLISHPGTT